MITELLGLAGSGLAGSIFGIFSDWLQNKNDARKLELELIQRQNGVTHEHINKNIDKPAFANAFFLLCFTYCACTILCFVYPEVIIYTFNPDEEPRKFSFLFGLFSFERQINYVYTISTGGIGFSLLHPLAS